MEITKQIAKKKLCFFIVLTLEEESKSTATTLKTTSKY